MITARTLLGRWCEWNLSRFQFDTTNIRITSPEDSLDKAVLLIEVGQLVASFTAWGEQGTTEWLVLNIETGETVISRDEVFSDAEQFTELLERAMLDVKA